MTSWYHLAKSFSRLVMASLDMARRGIYHELSPGDTSPNRAKRGIFRAISMRILSGVQPSGTLHLGNYFGAIQQHVELQDRGHPSKLLLHRQLPRADHVHDAPRLRELTRDVAIDYLALGPRPRSGPRSSASPTCPRCASSPGSSPAASGMGLLERAHSYKDKVARGIEASMGLFTYPVLMAADILIYRSTVVPVGKDQEQHVEMAQDMAGELQRRLRQARCFVRPEWRFSEAAGRARHRRRQDEQELRQHDSHLPARRA